MRLEPGFVASVVGTVLTLSSYLWADSPASAVSTGGDRKVATFSICAADPESGVCGAAVASMYPEVGHVVPYVRAGVGAFCTQHYHVPAWGERALNLLAAGRSPQSVLTELLDPDAQAGFRQLGIVDMQGRTANHNPTAAGADSWYWGAMSGRYYSCQGNTLNGREVITAMAQGSDFLASSKWSTRNLLWEKAVNCEANTIADRRPSKGGYRLAGILR